MSTGLILVHVYLRAVCALRPFSQLLIRKLLCVSARVVSKQRRYDFLSGNFLSLLKFYLATIGIFEVHLSMYYLPLIKRVSALFLLVQTLFLRK